MKKIYNLKQQLDTMINKMCGPSCLVVACETPLWLSGYFPPRFSISYPEHGLSLKGQASYMTDLLSGSSKELAKNVIIITRSPLIISDFHKDNVIIVKDETLEKPFVQTFGASYFDILTEIFECDGIGCIAKAQMDALIKQAENGEDIPPLKEKLLRTFGNSTEKVLAFHHLKNLEEKPDDSKAT